MKIKPEKIYHIYNQGNNQVPIFYQKRNYRYFLRKVRKYMLSQVNILAYCLMPNHFHFLVYSTSQFNPSTFSQNFKTLLSSYTRGINKQENRSGSLFRQNTKSKLLMNRNYALTCFRYIHQNPIRAGLVNRAEEWEFSSFRDYMGLRDGTLCNRRLTIKLLELPISRKDLHKFFREKSKPDDLGEIF